MGKESNKNNLPSTSNFLGKDVIESVPEENIPSLIKAEEKAKSWSVGFFGKIFGTNQLSISKFITFVIIFVFCIILLVDFIISIVKNKEITDSLYKYFLPIVTLGLGYLFGKN